MKNFVPEPFKPKLTAAILMTAVISALEVMVLSGIISYHVPVVPDPQLADIFFHYRKGYMPEREIELYGLGLAVAVLVFMIMVGSFHERLNRRQASQQLWRYIMLNGLSVGLEIAAVFYLVIHPKAGMAWGGLYVICGCSVLIKIFWSELSGLWPKTSSR